MESTWIWNQLRTKGGTYGGFVRFDPRSGILTYLSTQDPNLLATLETYDSAGAFLRRANLDERALTQSIVAAAAELDAYQRPDGRGFTSLTRHLSGETDEHRQRLRDELLSTTPAHFTAFSDVLESVRQQGHVVVVAAEKPSDRIGSHSGRPKRRL